MSEWHGVGSKSPGCQVSRKKPVGSAAVIGTKPTATPTPPMVQRRVARSAVIEVDRPMRDEASVAVAVRDPDGLRVVTLLVRRDVLLHWTPDVAGRIVLAELRAAVARAQLVQET